MEVSIQEIINYSSDGYSIIFETRFGGGRGVWNGEEPKLKQKYFIEFELPETLHWGKEITLSKDTECAIREMNDSLKITGRLESSYEDGSCVIRMDESIFLIETTGVPLPVTSFIDILVHKLILYDINL